MRRAALALSVLLTVAGLAGCSEEPAAEDQSSPPSATITIENGKAGPVERVEVERGEEVELVVKSDEAGSLHIHGGSEESLDYGAGTTSFTVSIDQPGVVDVESHELGELVLQLEVS